eukprot:336573-Pleurochrysis_carterae.AAC.1
MPCSSISQGDTGKRFKSFTPSPPSKTSTHAAEAVCERVVCDESAASSVASSSVSSSGSQFSNTAVRHSHMLQAAAVDAGRSPSITS